MPSIFLSHSTRDKPQVQRLAHDLRTSGIRVWLDEKAINVGNEILNEVEQGLSSADFIAVWLTPESVKSGWVDAEWKSRVLREMGTGQLTVLPLLGSDCTIPYWLKGRLYADFRTSYNEGLSTLLRALSLPPKNTQSNNFIGEKTNEFLEDLSDAAIEIPFHQPIKIVDTLKKMPRSGKLIRLHRYEPSVRIRSVFEHIQSVAHTADCLFGIADHDVTRGDAIELARLIAFHELNEVILGDIPAYTTLRPSTRARAKIVAEPLLRRVDVEIREKVTNAFIAMFLGEREKTALESVNKCREENTKTYKFFHVLDKIDPILSTWRYLFEYRGALEKDAHIFLSVMKDFFGNPGIKENSRSKSGDTRFVRMVESLQNSHRAREYYNEPDFFDHVEDDFGFDGGTMKRIVENFPAGNSDCRKSPH